MVSKGVKGIITFAAIVVFLILVYVLFLNVSSPQPYNNQNSELRNLQSQHDSLETKINNLDVQTQNLQNDYTQVANENSELRSKVNSLEWVQEELKWEIFQLRDGHIIDPSGLCTQNNIVNSGCLSMLTNVYRAFLFEDPKYCERVGEELEEICKEEYDQEEYDEWYQQYFLETAEIPTPIILDKAGICDQESLSITKQECLDMLDKIRLAITNQDSSYCESISDENMKTVCKATYMNYDNYQDWYDYYFLGTATIPSP